MHRTAGPFSGFWQSLRRLWTQPRTTPIPVQPRQPIPVPSAQPVVPQPVEPQKGPLTVEEIINVIRQAGHNRQLLDLKYDGVSRSVEPYSFKMAKNGNYMFYGYCHIHAKIHSFSVSKIEEIHIQDMTFAPRWPIEV